MSTGKPRCVLDANVLFPASLRDTLLRCAEKQLLEPLWSQQILEELQRNLVALGAMDATRASRLVSAMTAAFPSAMVDNYARHIPFMHNDAKDRHVAAAAVEGAASCILTLNLDDFVALPEGISAVPPATVLLDLLNAAPDTVMQTLKEQHAELRHPPYSLVDLLNNLERFAGPFTDEVRRRLADSA